MAKKKATTKKSVEKVTENTPKRIAPPSFAEVISLARKHGVKLY